MILLTYKKIILLTFLILFFNKDAFSQEQNSEGNISPNIVNKDGNVNFNHEDFGDKIAQFKIDKSDHSINITPTKNIKSTTINKINQLLIPKKIGFSEIFYNEKTNNFYVKNHKFSTTNKLSITNNNYNYIKTSISNMNSNNDTSITKNNTNNGEIYIIDGDYVKGNYINGDQVNDFSDNRVFINKTEVNHGDYIAIDNSWGINLDVDYTKEW